MPAFTQRLQQVIGSALILTFFSEFFFLNEEPVRALLDGLAENPFIAILGVLELSAYYGLFAYAFLICLGHFRVAGWAGLILAAGIYGLATEALVVPLVYEAIPVSLIWTSLSWHTLIDVVFGWYLLRRAMRARSWLPGAALMVLAGLLWGPWATWFWGDNGYTAPLTMAEFAAVAATTSAALLAGMVLADRARLSEFRATRAEIIVIGLVSAILFGMTGFAYFPLPVLILLLTALILLALKLGRGHGDPDFLAVLDSPPPWRRYLLVPLLPGAAITSYRVVLETGFQLPEDSVIPLIFAAGALSFMAALIVPFWQKLRRRNESK